MGNKPNSLAVLKLAFERSPDKVRRFLDGLETVDALIGERLSPL